MNKTCFLAIAAFLVIPSALWPEHADESKPGVPAPLIVTDAPALLTVAPVIGLDAASSMEVRIILENTSKEPIKYLLANDSRIIAGLNMRLERDGKLIQPQRTNGRPVLSKENIREIKPGEKVQPVWKLRDIYGDLKPGRYEFRIHYRLRADSGNAREYGMTPMSFEQKLYLEIK